MIKTFYSDKVAKIYYRKDIDAFFIEYLDKIPSEEYFNTKIRMEMLNAFLQLDTNIFIADIRKMGLLSVDSQKWIVDVMLKKMAEHVKGRPFIHLQIIDNNETLSKISGSNIRYKARDISSGFEILQFYDLPSIEKYLKELK